MTPEELLAARKEIKMSRAAFCLAVGVCARTVQNWENGTFPISTYAENAIRWVLHLNAWRKKLTKKEE